MGFQVGQRIGDYEVAAVLGAGGMGQVYKVRNVISERVEAMKILLPNLEGDPEGADRFLREIKVQASLDHPNIAALHTALRVDNQLLMVMEYVEGTTLEAMLRHGPVGTANAVDWVMQVLSALAYAHQHGVVHRDIKPPNMMLTPGGQIKLMDFGIARVDADRRLTQTGKTVGSLFYMSPEQIRGSGTDARSDLYSLGVTLYELVTGKRPFEGDSDFSIMAAHLQQHPVPPIQVDPQVPMALNEVILMAIAKDPQARFQTADAFHQALNNTRQLMNLPAGQGTMPISSMQQPTSMPTPAPPRQAGPPMQPPPYGGQQQAPPPYGGQPYGAPQAAPYMAPQAAAKSSSLRGVYMAVGSLLTLAVLALAVIKGPELMRTFAGTKKDPVVLPPQGVLVSNPQTTPGQPQTQTTPSQTQPSSDPAQNPVAQNPSTQPSQPSGAQDPPSSTKDPRQGKTTTVARATPQQPPTYQPPAQQQPAVNQPSTQQQPPSYQPPAQQQPQQQPQQQQPQADPNRAALNEVREHHNELAIRAGTIRGGLDSLRQQMANQGLGMRADIREAEQRMNYQLREATAAIRAGDVEAAKKHMDMASRAIETLERFLGR